MAGRQGGTVNQHHLHRAADAVQVPTINIQHSSIEGKVWKYGDGVNTDVIFPGKYTYSLKDPNEIAAHALEDLDPAFATEAQPGDVIVAGRNWAMEVHASRP